MGEYYTYLSTLGGFIGVEKIVPAPPRVLEVPKPKDLSES